MAFVVAGRTFGKEICEALDVDPGNVRNVTINIPADGLATVTLEMIVTREQADVIELVAQKRTWRLVEVTA